MLSFGVDSITIILNASMPKTKQTASGLQLKVDLFCDLPQICSQYPHNRFANYEIDVTNGPFQLARSASNSQVYTTDGKMPTENPDKTALLAHVRKVDLSLETRWNLQPTGSNNYRPSSIYLSSLLKKRSQRTASSRNCGLW